MIIAVLSYFHTLIGPKTLIVYPTVPDHIQLEHIPFLMDFYESGFFIHEFGDLKSANEIFMIPNPDARGGAEVLMLSIVMLDEKYDLNLFKELLGVCVNKIRGSRDIYLGLHVERTHTQEALDKFREIEYTIKSFFQSLPKERAVFKLRVTKIFVFGLPRAGASTVIKTLNNSFFNEEFLEEEISITKTLLGNLSIITYNFSEKEAFEEILSIYMRRVNGLVFVMDASDPSKFKMARTELHQISKFPAAKYLPLLILINKIDEATTDTEKIIEELDLLDLENESYKWFPVSALNNKGIGSAFKWLAVEISNRLLKDPSKIFL